MRAVDLETTKLSSKGQIILPKAVREAHRWQPGTEFIVEDTGDGILLRPARSVEPTRLEDVAGRLRVDGPVRTVEEMEAAIATELKERRGLGRY
ncbi:MAG TPA: AbrB/MazE/SpoVT family DNA-binding domain-containing protein [Burkholderiales bacterium]|nr:AbrB/MazE/SpoVT family DNA-binding domain-containing protein [Burkholderiales bacterium]